MYIRNVAIAQNTHEGGPKCVNSADIINNLPGEDDLIATPGSAA